MATKGKKQTKEHIKKRVESRRKSGNYTFTEEMKIKMSLSMLGRKRPGNPKNWKHTKETKGKISKNRKGVPALWCKGKIFPERRGENHIQWKGEDACYVVKHRWVSQQLGSPKYCEHCKRTDKKKYEWANKDHKYRRKLEDYVRLCTSCHRKYDIKFNN